MTGKEIWNITSTILQTDQTKIHTFEKQEKATNLRDKARWQSPKREKVKRVQTDASNFRKRDRRLQQQWHNRQSSRTDEGMRNG